MARAASETALARNNARDYYTRLFPADDVWRFYEPRWKPRVDSTEEQCVARLTKSVPANYRLYTFGPQEIPRRRGPASATELRQELMYNVKDKTRDAFRYDAGPVLAVPLREFQANAQMPVYDAKHKTKLNQRWIAYSEFRLDIDATDMQEVRQYCQCGGEKTKLCDKCALAVGAVARFYELKLLANFNIAITSWHSSGGRGLHAFSQHLAPSLLMADRRETIVADLKDDKTTPREALTVLLAAEGALEGTKFRPKLDWPVTTDPAHYTRGLFSVHDDTQRICVPIDSSNPQTFTRTSSPLLSDVLANPDGHVQWQTALQQLRTLNACKY